MLILFVSTTRSQSWIGVPYALVQSPRTLFWDTTSGWFYVGGEMDKLNGEKVNRMFRFNSSGKLDYLDTVNPNLETVLSIVKYKDTLYHFGYAGMYTYYNSTWQPKIKDHVFYDAFVYKNELLIGGYFKNAVSSNDGVVINYNGINFSPFLDAKTRIGGPTGESGSIGTFAEYKGKLYLAGNFSFDTTNNYYEIISWDGTNWDNLNKGIPGVSGLENISDLVVYKEELYVGGKFYSATGSQSNLILKWDGSNWHTLGEGLFGQGIADMLIYKDELWVIGALDSARGVHLGNVGIWNGSYWCSPGGQFDFMPFCGAVFGDTLYIGGNFDHIDGDPSLAYLVKYNSNAPRVCGDSIIIHPVGIDKIQSLNELRINIYPNPAIDLITFEVNSNTNRDVRLTLIDSKGSVTYLKSYRLSSGLNSIKLNVASLDEGLYVLRLTDPNTDYMESVKFLKKN